MMAVPVPNPLVSIIVPVFNGERYLASSLDTILAQTYSPIEVLVMDDASKDSTPQIIAGYGERIRSFRQPANRGIYGNMNDGIAMARGELIAIYHADDLYEPKIVERQVGWLQAHPDAGAAFCKDILINPEGKERGRVVLVPEVRGNRPLDHQTILNALLTYKNRFLRCPSCMVRAAVYQELGCYRDEQFKNTSDLEMYLRISREYPIGILDEYLFRYRWGHGNSAQRYKLLRTDIERFFTIMDLYLSTGGTALARPESLAAYEAHRMQDSLMRVVNLYILDKRQEALPILRQIEVRRLLGSGRIQRWRLFLLFCALQVLVRVPRIPFVSNLFYRRWHAKSAASLPVGPAKPAPAARTAA
jgi:glycosyltransferase involved in cell wall biosynthesis